MGYKNKKQQQTQIWLFATFMAIVTISSLIPEVHSFGDDDLNENSGSGSGGMNSKSWFILVEKGQNEKEMRMKA